MKTRSLVLICVALVAAGCSVSATAERPGEAADVPVTPAESAAVRALFDEIIERFPNASDSSDLVSGGPCPFGEQYGALLIERNQVLCIFEFAFVVNVISAIPVSVALAEEFELGGFESMVDRTGQVEWFEGDLGDERYVFVELIVGGFFVVSAQPLTVGATSEELASSMLDELVLTAVERVRTLATFDLDQIVATADEVSDL